MFGLQFDKRLIYILIGRFINAILAQMDLVLSMMKKMKTTSLINGFPTQKQHTLNP